jgi:hypothetical protein
VTIVDGQRQDTFPALASVAEGGTLTLNLAADTTVYCEWYFHLPQM